MNRRSMMAGMVGLTLGATPCGRSLAQTGQPADLAGCLTEPGIALFLDLFQGRSTLTSQELLPPSSWQLFASPATTVSFFFPFDWAAQVLFASTFTQSVAPVWTDQQQSASGLISARVLLPHSTAVWEYVIGTLQGVALTIDQAVAIAEGGVLGDGVVGNRLCAHTETTINGGTAWLTAAESNGSVLLTNGTLYADASGFSPFSVLTYFGMGGPREQLEQLMRTVFLPIQFQLLQSGDGYLSPTPTP